MKSFVASFALLSVCTFQRTHGVSINDSQDMKSLSPFSCGLSHWYDHRNSGSSKHDQCESCVEKGCTWNTADNSCKGSIRSFFSKEKKFKVSGECNIYNNFNLCGQKYSIGTHEEEVPNWCKHRDGHGTTTVNIPIQSLDKSKYEQREVRFAVGYNIKGKEGSCSMVVDSTSEFDAENLFSDDDAFTVGFGGTESNANGINGFSGLSSEGGDEYSIHVYGFVEKSNEFGQPLGHKITSGQSVQFKLTPGQHDEICNCFNYLGCYTTP